MLTYQVRKRVLRHDPEAELTFPADCLVEIMLRPSEPFGERGDGGRTVVKAKAASLLFDANTGNHTFHQDEWLDPVDVTIVEGKRVVMFKGRHLTITERFESVREFYDFIFGIQFGLPALLSVGVQEPPSIERIFGTVSGVPFRWELTDWRVSVRTTTQELQEANVAKAWTRLRLVAAEEGTRLLAALAYFHHARRLQRAGVSPWEFMPEVLLNLAKVLEALFPVQQGGGTIDAARKGLTSIGITGEDAERYFIPAIALRNRIDSGHVDFTLFTTAQLTVLHRYSAVAEEAFSRLLNLILEKTDTGSFSLPVVPLEGRKPDRDSLRVIERLAAHYGGAEEPTLTFSSVLLAG